MAVVVLCCCSAVSQRPKAGFYYVYMADKSGRLISYNYQKNSLCTLVQFPDFDPNTNLYYYPRVSLDGSHVVIMNAFSADRLKGPTYFNRIMLDLGRLMVSSVATLPTLHNYNAWISNRSFLSVYEVAHQRFEGQVINLDGTSRGFAFPSILRAQDIISDGKRVVLFAIQDFERGREMWIADATALEFRKINLAEYLNGKIASIMDKEIVYSKSGEVAPALLIAQGFESPRMTRFHVAIFSPSGPRLRILESGGETGVLPWLTPDGAFRIVPSDSPDRSAIYDPATKKQIRTIALPIGLNGEWQAFTRDPCTIGEDRKHWDFSPILSRHSEQAKT